MKILALHIYHFGALKDCKLTLDRSGFQLLFGENEAGKTTLMDFIKCMLFGFPLKNQSKRQYDPKNGNRAGGKMTVEHPELGIWTIERVSGTKASGDVTIFNESGQQKEELFLSQLLDGMDQSLFTGAYCFGLDGLQKLDKLTSEELGNFLMSTAISGDRDLLEIEQTFEKKQSALFKKAGKKPVINEKLEHLKGEAQSLQKLKEKNENYQMIENQKESLETKIEETSRDLELIQKELRSIKRLFELRPVLEKFKQLNHELKSFGTTQLTFPENGIQRYEQWQKEVSLLNGELQYIEDRLDKIINDQQMLETDERLLSHEKEIKQLFNQIPQYEHLQEQINQLNSQIDEWHEEETGLFDAIGETWHERELKELSLSLSSLHEHEELLKQYHAILDKKRRLEADLEDSRVKLESLEKEEAERKALLLPDEELTRYEQERNKKDQTKAFPAYAWMLPVISAVVLIWSGWSSKNQAVMYAGILLLLLAGGLAIFTGKKRAVPQGDKLITNQRYLEDEENRKLWIQLTAALQHEYKVYLQIAKQLDYLEVEEAKVYDRAEAWAEQCGYDGDKEKLKVSGYMNSLMKIKEVMKQKENTIKKRENTKAELSRLNHAAEKLALHLEIEAGRDFSQLIETMHEKLETQVQNKTEREHLRKSYRELTERKDALSKQIDSIYDRIAELWDEAGVDTEEAYYEAGRKADAFIKVSNEFGALNNQLLSLGFDPNDIQTMAEKMTEKYEETVQLFEELERKEERHKNEHTAATEEKAKLLWQMKNLLEDGSYSEHLHRYELLKDEWNLLVKKWASMRLAQHALQKVKEDYQKTKLPAVLETSSVYFSKITEGEYQSIIFTDANELIVLKADGTRFYPHELSRGTAEQVYLAIRLAVAANAGPDEFPIFMDDIAVNFDQNRTRRTLSLIQEIARDRQVLFFTCHAHLEVLVPNVPFIHWPDRSVLAEK
ncbi:ATP-binding protein [Fictibacillus phosphorivorans]|uniref:ATP-binding protein n=1 Tax=Fictibacillus phosphorivorans TaxID=1221500 RepID=UPI00203D749C|nr:AAA family ATPase [Fictibacillus phosphorivorans]MCM3717508.1 AAA family ATPase [Fictibacillus phosphorivorans]MCM3775203.1 AAA family ATPase [Fictibacillus phosphorivorans]